MKKLSPDWFVEPAIDFELKSYQLLAWLKELEGALDKKMFFPLIDELLVHIRNLEQFRTENNLFMDQFRNRLSGINEKSMSIVYDSNIVTEPVFQELNKIVEWSLNKLKKEQEHFNHALNHAMASITISPIGLVPLYQKEGYLFIPLEKSVAVYEYTHHEILNSTEDNYFYTQTEALGQFEWVWYSGYEDLKLELNKQYRKFDLPATFLCEHKDELPLNESLLPLAKKRLSAYLTNSK